MLQSILDFLSFFVDLIRGLIQLVISLLSGLHDLISALLLLPVQIPVMLGWIPPAVFALISAGVAITIIKLVVGRNN